MARYEAGGPEALGPIGSTVQSAEVFWKKSALIQKKSPEP